MVSLFPHPASFRFHLAVNTLAFGYILPTTGRIRDLHPLETCAAGRTSKKALASIAAKRILLLDHSKWGVSSLCSSIRLEEIDVIITDTAAPADSVEEARARGIEVVLVSP